MSGFEDRKEYAKGQLTAETLQDVDNALRRWLTEAKQSDPQDYNAMTLSTVGLNGHPNARVVLLRSVEEVEGAPAIAFYTNYQSEKGQELTAHPHAAATLFWKELERQLRIKGRVTRMSEAASDRYFASRPRESQIGAWASEQSRPVSDRKDMESAWAAFDRKHPDVVPRPSHWGGFLLVAEQIEFWQGRPGRMHDRLEARKLPEGWDIRRLQP
ncbi:MAG: pyridoxamine 5'-phosphate oxidase [Flavobacteriales bacterium]|nr:pyridoxamine 5'-phosphate oxidase [Flavobacteriales bacterium]